MAFNTSIIGQDFGPFTFEHDWKAPALYALGCGAGPDDLGVLLETRGPKVVPTFSVVVAVDALRAALANLGGNMLTLVHGAQKCVIHRPLLSSAKLTTTARVAALYDKGKGALAIFETRTTDADGDPMFDTEWQIFYRGEGGFGGERGPETPDYTPPADRSADHTVTMATSTSQALLYRIASGDLNPIHSDPDVATAVGFPKPILHGLCTFGHAARAAIATLCDGDPERMTHIEGRFTKPVFPGDTLVTEIFRMGEGEAYFNTRVSERNEAAINLGRVLFRA